MPPPAESPVTSRALPTDAAVESALVQAYVRDAQIRTADLEPWLRRMRTLELRAIRG
jgi:hypothetical protein